MFTSLLDQPAPLGVRLIALELLDDASAAHVRLTDKGDTAALHDFRVSLRRLRSWLRSDAWIGGKPPKKISQHIHSIAHATNTSRDIDVLLDWVVSHRDDLTPRERKAENWLLDWLHRHDHEVNVAAQIAYADFEKHAHSWHHSLAKVRIRTRVDDPASTQSLREHVGKLIESRSNDLEAAFTAIKGVKDREHIHRTRIIGKRLRYAIEPFTSCVEGAEQAVVMMETVQDESGIICDRKAFLQLLEQAASAAAKHTVQAEFDLAQSTKTDTSPRIISAVPGILALTRIAATEEHAQYHRLRKVYLGPHAIHIFDSMRKLVDSFTSHT